jgi:hypothetical protein
MKILNNDELKEYAGGGTCAMWMLGAAIAASLAGGPIAGWAATGIGFLVCEYLC